MKKNFLLVLGAAMMLVFGMSGCSKDDDVDNELTTLDGTWDMVKASYGFNGVQEYQAGEVTITFNNKDKNLIIENDKGIFILKSGIYPYKTETEQKRIMTNEWVDVEYQVIVINYTDEAWGNREIRFTYGFNDGMLVLDGGMASDGPGYYFKKLTSSDDEKDNVIRNGNTVRGGEVYDGWGKPEVDESDPLALFFRDELHGPYWDGAGNEIKTFFEHGSWDEEGCLVINSRQEFQDAYMGTREMPEVDFNNYTLLIGKTWGNDSSYKLDDVILRDMNDFFELEARLLHYVDRLAYDAIVHIYYWRLYPKLEEKDIVLKRTVEDVKG